MSSRIISLSAMGTNRSGTLSNYFKKIYNNFGNVQHSSLFSNNDTFVLNAKIQFPKDANLNFLYPHFYTEAMIKPDNMFKQAISDESFYVILNDSKPYKTSSEKTITINTKIADTSGIISKQLSLLEDSGCKITNFDSSYYGAPHSSTPIFTLNLSANFHKDNNNINDVLDKMRRQNAFHICDIKIDDDYVTEYDGMGF